jgi:hypothetical protein
MRCPAVGGGPGSLQNVVEAIEGNFPMVVIKGTGRVADLICAIRERQSTRFVKNQCKGDLPFIFFTAAVLTCNACFTSSQC